MGAQAKEPPYAEGEAQERAKKTKKKKKKERKKRTGGVRGGVSVLLYRQEGGRGLEWVGEGEGLGGGWKRVGGVEKREELPLPLFFRIRH